MKKKNKRLLIILLLIVICSIGGAYAFFYYYQEQSDLNVITLGDIKFYFRELISNDTNNITPMSDDEARNGHYLGQVLGEEFSVHYTENDDVFLLQAINDYEDQDIEYKIILEHNDDIAGKTRMNDWDIVFDVLETDSNGSRYLVKGEGYSNFDGLCIYTGRIGHSENFIDKYITIRSWVNENTLFSNSNPYSEYDGTEDLFYGYRVKVIAELKEPIKKACSIMWDMDDTLGVTYSNYAECDNYSGLISLLTDYNTADWDNVKSLKVNYDLNDTNIDFDFYTWGNGSTTYMSNLVNFDMSGLNMKNIKHFNIYNAYRVENIVGLNTVNTNSLTGMIRSFSNGINESTMDAMKVIKINNWNFSRINSMDSAFFRTSAYIINLPKNLSGNRISFANTFRSSNVRYLDFSTWNISGTNMGYTFKSTKYLDQVDLSSFIGNDITSIRYLFQDSNVSHINFGNLTTYSLTAADYAFAKTPRLTSLDLSSFDFSSVTECNNMFSDTESLSIVYSNSSTNFNRCTTSTNMFTNSGLVGELGSKVTSSAVDKTYAHVDSTSSPGYFTSGNDDYCYIYYSFDDTTNYDHMVECTGLNDIWNKLGFMGGNLENVGNIKSLKLIYRNRSGNDYPFQYSNSLLSGMENSLVRIDLSDFDTSEFSSLSSLFGYFTKLESVNLSGLDTRNVDSLSMMFYNCSKLTEIDLSSFNTVNVVAVDGMFCGCTNLKRIIGTLNMRFVTGFSNMFKGCKNLEYVDLSGFNALISIGIGMFSGCDKLKVIDLSNMYFDDIQDVSNMFETVNSTALKVIYVNNSVPSYVYGDSTFKNRTTLKNYNSGNYSGDYFKISGCLDLLT